ncbi:putative acetyltransferase [Amycolatopsis lexingtonensis]|uniref:Acetyltransferase n=1 Tax=Amycolatopsis lexingtonensis TaxID=218822 RepID=A0ABR9I4U1_9PSEU|nr:GNAT family N-acetyltransferase [Amycolatopsis lexingtonensis]MBE1498170.1 putative acetyltransferase [Amycolatopsis lexingtonensis]
MQKKDSRSHPGSVTLRPADTGTRPVVERLAQLERHELSQFTGDLPGPDGQFDFPRLSRFFTEAGHHADLILSGEQLAGFCLTRPFDGGSNFIHAFFIVRALRQQGVGRAAATGLLRSRRGRWAIAFVEENEPAARFWRQVATDVVGDTWTSELRRAPNTGRAFRFLHVDVDRHESALTHQDTPCVSDQCQTADAR